MAFGKRYLALLVFTQQSRTSVGRAFVVRYPSSFRPFNSGFSETALCILARFYGKLPTQHISKPNFKTSSSRFFCPQYPHEVTFHNFQILNFNIFFSLSSTWDNMAEKVLNCYSSHKSRPNLFKPLLKFGFNNLNKVTFSEF